MLFLTSLIGANEYLAGNSYEFIFPDNGHYILKFDDYNVLDINVKDNKCLVNLPCDLPTKKFYFVNDSNEKVISFDVKGKFKPLIKKSKNISNLTFKLNNKAIAKKAVKFTVSGNILNNAQSDKVIFIFEKRKDVSYFITSQFINIKNKKGAFSECLDIILPEKIPAGDYTVYCLLNNDIFLNPTEEKISHILLNFPILKSI